MGKTVAQLRRKYKSINFPARTNRKDGEFFTSVECPGPPFEKRQNIKRKMWRKFNEYKLAREGGNKPSKLAKFTCEKAAEAAKEM